MWCKSLLHSQSKLPYLVIPHSSCGTSAVTDRYAHHWGQHYRDGNFCSTSRKHGTPVIYSLLIWFQGEKFRRRMERWKFQHQKKTEPKNPKLWLIINVKCQSLKLSFFSCAWVHKGEVPSEDDFIFYFWVWRSWMWFGKFIKILWWSWAAIWKYYVQRCKKA